MLTLQDEIATVELKHQSQNQHMVRKSSRLIVGIAQAIAVCGAFLAPISAKALESLQPGMNDATCRTMAPGLVYVITIGIFLCIIGSIIYIKFWLESQGWSISNAISEPTHLKIPMEYSWLLSAGDKNALKLRKSRQKNLQKTKDHEQRDIVSLTCLEASSSKAIALIGTVCILLLFSGFGAFALFNFGLTCTLPESMPDITKFLLTGLSFFAPYTADKVSKMFNFRSQKNSSEENESTEVSTISRQSEESTHQTPTGVRQTPRSSKKHSAHHENENHSIANATVTTPAAVDGLPELSQLSSEQSEPSQAQSSSSNLSITGHSETTKSTSQDHQSQQQVKDSASQQYAPALKMIRDFEGFRGDAYPDPATGSKPWTIGYGFTQLNHEPVQPGDIISESHAERILQNEVNANAAILAGSIPHWSEMNVNQQSALLDFGWNLGIHFYGASGFETITKNLKTYDWSAVPNTLLLYCNPGTNVEEGLRRRRKAEGQLWATPIASSLVSNDTSAKGSTQKISSKKVLDHASNPLIVPYCDQLKMADGEGWRECFSASAAMLAMYWGKEPNEDAYDQLREHYGSTTSAEVQVKALRSLGLDANFHTDGTEAMLKSEIDAGRPVGVGWLIHGPVAAPSGGGHWSVIIGYDDSGFIVNDPNGICDLVGGNYLSHDDGAGVHYCYKDWLPRWRVDGTGGWMLTCSS